MRIKLSIVFIFINLVVLYGANLDSLKHLLIQPTTNDSLKIAIYTQIGRDLIRESPTEAYNHTREAIALSVKNENKEAEVNFRILFGIVNKKIGNFEKAINSYFEALTIAKSINNISLESTCLNNIGNIYQEQNNFDKALEFFKQSLEIEEKLKNKSQISLRYYNIGAAYELKDSLDLAYSYYLNSLLIEQEINNKEGIYFAYYGLSGIERNREDFDRSLDYLRKALNIAEDLNDKAGISICLNEIGKLYSIQNELDSGIVYLEQSISTARSIQYKNIMKDGFSELSKIYAKLKQYDKAFQFQTHYLQIKDSINNIEINSKIAEIETRYELDIKEQTIHFLESKAEDQKNNYYYLILSSLLLMTLALSNLARIVENWYDVIIYSVVISIVVLAISWLVAYIRQANLPEAQELQFISAFADVITIAILPLFAFILIYERFALNKHLKTAKELSHHIKGIKKPEVTPIVEFLAENQKDKISLELNDLLFIEANDNYSGFCFSKGNLIKNELLRGSLKRMQDQIQEESLVRCHKSYIVNLNKINNVVGNAKGYRLQFSETDIEIPVSRNFPKSIIEKIKSEI